MITVALPTYNNANIIWLQLESLCRQENAPEWELIVCEEESNNYFGLEGLAQYTDRLKAANCTRIVYVSLSEWIPLGQKWIEIRDRMHPNSIAMMLCASDNYSAPDRIAKTYEAMRKGADWVQWNRGAFYNILAHDGGIFNARENDPALFMCVSRERLALVQTDRYPTRGVDSWLLKATLSKAVDMGETMGVHTDGFNTISHRRKTQYTNSEGKGLFESISPDEVFARFPKDIQERLTQMRNANN
jgi:hypothetical protein